VRRRNQAVFSNQCAVISGVPCGRDAGDFVDY
jgi:hypothetical protein